MTVVLASLLLVAMLGSLEHGMPQPTIGERPALPGAIPAALAAAPGFHATFDGGPPSPTPWRPRAWDVVVHSRDVGTWRELEPMHADHGPDCGPPPATHVASRYEDAVFQCRDHLMTAVNSSSYGVAYLTPNQLVDFSAGEAVVRWDMSTFRSSERDWVDLWVTPYEDNLQLPLHDWMPDLNGAPRRSLNIQMDFASNAFKANITRNGVAHELAEAASDSYETFLVPSQTRRDTFELRISRTRIKFGMPRYNVWWIDAPVQDLGWSRGVVQLGHHSYTPTKDCPAGRTCRPNTWHWDNLSIAPAVPFTMLKGNQRWVDRGTSPAVTFPAPAPAGASLRFSAIGESIGVSFDGGRTWTPARRQGSTVSEAERKHESFSSYWMPIPQGATRVDLRGQDWWGGEWMVRDMSVWSLT